VGRCLRSLLLDLSVLLVPLPHPGQLSPLLANASGQLENHDGGGEDGGAVPQATRGATARGGKNQGIH